MLKGQDSYVTVSTTQPDIYGVDEGSVSSLNDTAGRQETL